MTTGTFSVFVDDTSLATERIYIMQTTPGCEHCGKLAIETGVAKMIGLTHDLAAKIVELLNASDWGNDGEA